MTLDLHRHGEYSAFDGFGKAQELARLAKQKGLTALGLSDHGTMGGAVEHWKACLAEGIKPVIGVEAYFQPKFNKENPKRDYFHLCLFAQNLEGYKNLNRIQTVAFNEQRYYKPIVDFPLLEKYSEGIIATSGCIASFISQTIAKGKMNVARKAIEKFIDIFGDNFYIELQPYRLVEKSESEGKRLQERVNIELVKLAKKYNLKMVLTSDAHYGSEHDYDTYCKMHEIKGSGEFNSTYSERYMPSKNDLVERFVKMHGDDFKDAKKIALEAMKGLQEIEDKVEMDILGQLKLELPKFSNNSKKLLLKEIKEGLKEKNLYNKQYLARAKEEFDVIVHHGFEDYFLIVQDYTRWAKNENIKVGPGRGSVCNSLVAYALGITEVDPIYFNIDFRRFLRKDKKKMPDIDLDFETERRHEVIEYIIGKYPGKAAQICSYGTYQVDNLLNDLFKVCGPEDANSKKEIKDWVRKQIDENDKFDYETVKRKQECKMYNKLYDNIILHFGKMFKKVRFIGTHAAGVAVVGGDLLDYSSIEVRGNKTSGYVKTTAYDLNNLEEINAIKFDILGLRTLSITKELEELTDDCFNYDWLEDEELYDYFREGKTDGIFQLEKPTAKKILSSIETHNANDIIATSALNRPGPLQLKMPDQYAEHKKNKNYGKEPWAEFTNETYGAIVYQEQVQSIVTEIGLLTWADADKVLKVMKSTYDMDRNRDEVNRIRKGFIEGCKKSRGMSKEEALQLFNKLIVYSFNKGHSTGYSLISIQQMYYKVNYPELFWYVTLKYANDADLYRLKAGAVKDGNVILIPHVNYGTRFSIVEIEGENALAEGLINIKGVGEKAALSIEEEKKKNGKFTSRENFLERVPKRTVNAGTVKALEESGALVFDKNTYFERVKKYNSRLYMYGGM